MKNKISSQKFDSYTVLSQSAKNWDIHCAYQLFPHALNGENHIITLPTMQLSYSFRDGGFMHRAIAPKNAISIGVILKCEGIASFDRIKLHQGDIVFFDDSKALHFMSRDKIEVAIVSLLPNTKNNTLSSLIHSAIGQQVKDKNSGLTQVLQQTLKNFMQGGNISDLHVMENKIIEMLQSLFETQVLETPRLTKGENISFDILEKVYGHMDGKINIKALTQAYNISGHTLQTSFKALFGFTPKRFFLLLKLNHVHYDLTNANHQSSSVSRIAQKWGFTHMGRFSRYYTDLFGENPSITLKKKPKQEGSITSECASRQEEIEM